MLKMTYLMTACNRDLNLSFNMFIELSLSCVKFLKVTINELGFMNVILLHSNHQHGPTTHVVIFWVMSTRIKM